jgi:adenine-specific DNA-methyltransferase
MNSSYICEKCGKDFVQKSRYDRHMNRKTICKPSEQSKKITRTKKINTSTETETETETEIEIEIEIEIENSSKMNINYSELSYTLTQQLSKEVKKNNGIYFTPPNTIYDNIEAIKKYLTTSIRTILEPSCGSCEYIIALNNLYPELQITGIEYNETIYDMIKSLEIERENIKIYNEDYLLFNEERGIGELKSNLINEKYDLIIGNPPYYVMNKSDVSNKYFKYFDGRPNIFILFIIKSLKLLNDEGILSFVLPKNFLNCSYYNKTREFINTNYSILNVIICNDKYIETNQDTIILIVKNSRNNSTNKLYTLSVNGMLIFGTPEIINELNFLYENSTTLYNLNFSVNVGNIVWNQHKDILTDDSTKTSLIYSSDIRENKFIRQKYSNLEKKNYINKSGNKDILLIINRGYGVGKYKFEYCLLDVDFDYLIENHLICIKYKSEVEPETLKRMYHQIINSFENEKTQRFIELYFGNNAINTTEIQKILPIYF